MHGVYATKFAIAALGLALALPQTALAQPVPAPAVDPAALKATITAKEKDPGAAPEVFAAYRALALHYAAAKDVKLARESWQRAAQHFVRGKFEKNGDAVARVAAEAELRLLEPAVTAALEHKIAPLAAGTPPKQLDELRKHLNEMQNSLLGAVPKNGTAQVARKGGLLDQLGQVFDYKADEISLQSALQLAKIATQAASTVRALKAVEMWTPVEIAALEAETKQIAPDFEQRELFFLEPLYRRMENSGFKSPLIADLRKELNHLRPKDYPLSDAQNASDVDQVTPEQAEASKAAGLAQGATNLTLKVKYLRKACKLDPKNTRYQELLNAAEADLLAEKTK